MAHLFLEPIDWRSLLQHESRVRVSRLHQGSIGWYLGSPTNRAITPSSPRFTLDDIHDLFGKTNSLIHFTKSRCFSNSPARQKVHPLRPFRRSQSRHTQSFVYPNRFRKFRYRQEFASSGCGFGFLRAHGRLSSRLQSMSLYQSVEEG
jgi:hypothetical protein